MYVYAELATDLSGLAEYARHDQSNSQSTEWTCGVYASECIHSASPLNLMLKISRLLFMVLGARDGIGTSCERRRIPSVSSL